MASANSPAGHRAQNRTFVTHFRLPEKSSIEFAHTALGKFLQLSGDFFRFVELDEMAGSFYYNAR